MYLLCFFLGIACLWDYSTGRIPNFLQFNLMCIGILYSYGYGGWKGLLGFAVKVVVVGAILFPLFVLSMIGGGDVKMIALAAGYFSKEKILWFAFYIALCAAIIAIARLVISKSMRARWAYFFKYIRDFFSTGVVKPYHISHEKQVNSSIVMSGPILFSALLAWGGVY